MKISSITMKNFKGINEAQITPEKLNVFTGKNGSGKSSHLAAIAFALTGKINSDFIKKGEKSLSVLIEFEDGTTIERSNSHEYGTVTKCNGKSQLAQLDRLIFLIQQYDLHDNIYAMKGDYHITYCANAA